MSHPSAKRNRLPFGQATPKEIQDCIIQILGDAQELQTYILELDPEGFALLMPPVLQRLMANHGLPCEAKTTRLFLESMFATLRFGESLKGEFVIRDRPSEGQARHD